AEHPGDRSRELGFPLRNRRSRPSLFVVERRRLEVVSRFHCNARCGVNRWAEREVNGLRSRYRRSRCLMIRADGSTISDDDGRAPWREHLHL
ncbi:hypothetical protein GW17_00007120, partial [Ensete ventricosum]